MTTFTRCAACACSFIRAPRTGMGVDERECPCCRKREADEERLRALERVAATAKKIDETILSPDGDDIDCPCACGFGDGREGDGRCGMHTDISDLRAALKEAGL